ncbi:hypothetical protein BKP42_36130 [Rhodococcus erythropolis]|nr:hypothetical protein BKP42_36130 [Rhodococcus erythropolis]
MPSLEDMLYDTEVYLDQALDRRDFAAVRTLSDRRRSLRAQIRQSRDNGRH